MATLASSRDKVKERLILSGSGEGGDPDDAEIVGFLREGYLELLGQFSLPTRAVATCTEDASGTVTAQFEDVVTNCHFIGFEQRYLLPSLEYLWDGETIHFSPGVVVDGDEVWAWVTRPLDLTVEDIENIDTGCVHGPDWFEPACLWFAELKTLSRMARPAGSTGAQGHGAHYRSLEPGYQSLLKAMKLTQDTWMNQQLAAINGRLQLGDQPLFESRYATIRERRGGRKTNRTVGT